MASTDSCNEGPLNASAAPPVIPVYLPVTTLRPFAFRIFTQKHSLNLNASALALLASYIGKTCGAEWRTQSSTEKLLDDTARLWKKLNGPVLVSGTSQLGQILDEVGQKIYGRGDSGVSGHNIVPSTSQDDVQEQASRGGLEIVIAKSGSVELQKSPDSKKWLRVISAFHQPRLVFNPSQKRFEIVQQAPSLVAEGEAKMLVSRQRFLLAQQILLHHAKFLQLLKPADQSQVSGDRVNFSGDRRNTSKLYTISQLLGRSGSAFLILGILSRSPTGQLMLNDQTASIALNIQSTIISPASSTWLTTGMTVIVEGKYEQREQKSGLDLDGNSGVGGVLSGQLLVSGISGPPCELRESSLGLDEHEGKSHSANFGWVDFLGTGSEKAIGQSMRSLQRDLLSQKTTRTKIVILGEVNVDNSICLKALRTVLMLYTSHDQAEIPIAFILLGNFISYATISGMNKGGSIECKEHFDSLAAVLAEFPILLQMATFIFVPGDNDPWASSFSAGATSTLPQAPVPDIFTTRIKRVFATANAEAKSNGNNHRNGEAIWTSNPSRLSIFGTAQEMVLFRDDLSSRLRRNALRFQAGVTQKEPLGSQSPLDEGKMNNPVCSGDEEASAVPEIARKGTTRNRSDQEIARKLIRTVLNQANLSPFPLSTRPVLWSYAGALSLFPQPTSLVLMDSDAPTFATTFEGCHVMNPGCLVLADRKGLAQYIEFSIKTQLGTPREIRI